MLLTDSVSRHFLFLQGPGGRFFAQLSRRLETATSTTSRINVCPGDFFMWRRRGNSTNYRGRYEDWQKYLQAYVVANGVTDIVLFSDSRPYHRVAKIVAEQHDINLFVFENGYLRPDWITLELGGVNGNSAFPRTRAKVEQLPAPPAPDFLELKKPTKLQSYWPDVKFHFGNTFFAPLFPFYRRHRTALPLAELFGHGIKWMSWPIKHFRSNKTLDRLWRTRRPYYLFALQLEHDYQLIEHSPFESMRQATDRVLESFAANAPQDSMLLVKNHPLDNNLVSRRREIMRLAKVHGVADRVVYVDMGPNPQILENASGMVTVNSTLGTSALFHGVPVCAMGRAVYDIEGLTHQLGLDAFWQNPTQPDGALFSHFRRALIANCQIRGRFVTAQGRNLAARACAERMIATPYIASIRTRVKVAGSTELQPRDDVSNSDNPPMLD